MTFITLSLSYGLIVFPVLLTICGPSVELPLEIPEAQIDQPRKHIDEEDDYGNSPGAARRVRNQNQSQKSQASKSRRGSLPSSHFSRREHPRVQSEISLSTIAEERESMANFQSSHERIVVEPEFVVETITTSSPVQTASPTAQVNQQGPHFTTFQTSQHSQQYCNNMESPIPESPLSTDYNRDSPLSDTTSSASGGISRPNSAPVPGSVNSQVPNQTNSQFTHAFNPQLLWNPNMMHHHQPQTVTTKVTTTAKLKLELQGIPLRKTSYSSSSSSNSSSNDKRSNR
jgi:hypothetical protein